MDFRTADLVVTFQPGAHLYSDEDGIVVMAGP